MAAGARRDLPAAGDRADAGCRRRCGRRASRCAAAAARRVVVVGDHDDRGALGVEFLEQVEDRGAGGAVEVAGGLVGQHDRPACPASARAIATRCRSPPDSCVGRASGPVRRARPGPARCGRASPPLAGATPAYSSPSATFSSAVACSARKNCWNTKPIRCARSPASAGPTCRDVLPGDPDGPGVGRSRVPITCSSVDLPEPGRAHDRHQLARGHGQADRAARSPAARPGRSC